MKLADQVNIKPEVLFSMYASDQEMSSYLKFVFPSSISLERQDENVVPKFFTFMSTDDQGINAYFHCLIFYE